MKDRRLPSRGFPPQIRSTARNFLGKYHTFIAVLILSALLSIGQPIEPVSANDAPHVEVSTEYPEIYMDIETLTAEPSVTHSSDVRIFGQWRMGCVPQYMAHSIEGNKVRIFAVAEPADMVCGQDFTEWGFVTPLQLETPGEYSIHVFAMSEQQPAYQLYATTSIEVADISVQDSQLTEAVSFSPTNPNPGEPVTISVNGVNSDACVPAYGSHEINGYTITIDASKPLDLVCGQVITPWSWSTDVGALQAGMYTVEVYVTSPTFDGISRELYQTNQMAVGVTGTVRRSQQLLYIPSVLFE